MSAEQLRRAAEEADRIAFTTDHGSDVDVLVAALLRAAAAYHEAPDSAAFLAVLNTVDDVAAAYLGEEPQP